MAVVRHKEAIHSGHFMISNFEAEAQDDEENIAVPVSIMQLLVIIVACRGRGFLLRHDNSLYL